MLKNVFSCPLVGRGGGGPNTHCCVLKIALFINQCSHKAALFTWFCGYLAFILKLMRWLWIWLIGDRRSVGGQSCPIWAKYFFRALDCIRTQCETKSMGWWDDALLFIFNISAFDSRLRNCTSPQSQDWFLQNSGKTKISWKMFEMKPHPRTKLIFDNIYRKHPNLLIYMIFIRSKYIVIQLNKWFD